MTATPARSHFERVGPTYTRWRSAWPLGVLRAQEQRAVHALVHLEPGARVLDVGCGDGEIMAWLATTGARPFGIDYAGTMARICRRRGLLVSVQDMEQLGLRPNFDWVFCIGALEFASRPMQVLHGFADCLRPGGRLVLLFPHRSLLGLLYATYHRSHGVRIRLFSREEMTALLTVAGLEPHGWRRCALSTACLAQRTT